jgi:hypothetical protein
VEKDKVEREGKEKNKEKIEKRKIRVFWSFDLFYLF